MNSNLKKGLCVLSFLTAGFSLFGQSTESDYLIKMDVDKIGSTIQPTMYGVFFEDINFGADGGLYAELIKNRSFEFEYPFTGWTPFGDVSIRSDKPCFDRNPHYARLINRKQLTGTGLINEGFKGIGIKTNEKYDLSFYARTSLLSGEILPQLKLRRTITLRNISSEIGLIKYIFDVASFEEDLTNRV